MIQRRPAYQILVEPPARKALKKLPREVASRLIQRIESLADDPRPHGAIKLSGEDAYRTRVGDYRIVYAILDDRLLILVLDVAHRRDIYRNG